jgi:hypothetical protein
MNNETVSDLTLHPVAATLPQSSKGGERTRLQTIVELLEQQLVTRSQDKIFLTLYPSMLADLAATEMERLLRYTACRRILLLAQYRHVTEAARMYQAARSFTDAEPLTAHFPMTTQLEGAQQARVCISSVFNIQKRFGEGDTLLAFLALFDALLIYRVPQQPGPIWQQIVDLVAASGNPVIGLQTWD